MKFTRQRVFFRTVLIWNSLLILVFLCNAYQRLSTAVYIIFFNDELESIKIQANSSLSFILSLLSNKHTTQRRSALLKGLVTSQNIGSLLLFFAYGVLLSRKKICEFEQSLVLKQNIYLTVSGRKSLERRAIFPAKRLFEQNQTKFKSADFFPRTFFFFFSN